MLKFLENQQQHTNDNTWCSSSQFFQQFWAFASLRFLWQNIKNNSCACFIQSKISLQHFHPLLYNVFMKFWYWTAVLRNPLKLTNLWRLCSFLMTFGQEKWDEKGWEQKKQKKKRGTKATRIWQESQRWVVLLLFLFFYLYLAYSYAKKLSFP